VRRELSDKAIAVAGKQDISKNRARGKNTTKSKTWTFLITKKIQNSVDVSFILRISMKMLNVFLIPTRGTVGPLFEVLKLDP
jgi:hypothetical protein